jgi:hypothetical protein
VCSCLRFVATFADWDCSTVVFVDWDCAAAVCVARPAICIARSAVSFARPAAGSAACQLVAGLARIRRCFARDLLDLCRRRRCGDSVDSICVLPAQFGVFYRLSLARLDVFYRLGSARRVLIGSALFFL